MLDGEAGRWCAGVCKRVAAAGRPPAISFTCGAAISVAAPRVFFRAGAELLEEERALTREAGRRLRAAFPEWDVRAEAASAASSAAAALLRRAAAWGADLLVVGLAGPSAQNLNAGG